MMSNNVTSANEMQKQKILLIAYSLGLCMFFVLRVLRNNQEFLFFSGVLAGLFLLYNFKLFSIPKIRTIYLGIVVLLGIIFVVVQKETISMLFPLTAFILSLLFRAVFLKMYNNEPQVDILLNKNSNRLFSFTLFFTIAISWIVIVVVFMDHYIV